MYITPHISSIQEKYLLSALSKPLYRIDLRKCTVHPYKDILFYNNILENYN